MELNYNEILFIRQSLELPSISGKDAKFLANLQIKMENEMAHLQGLIDAEEKKTTDISEK